MQKKRTILITGSGGAASIFLIHHLQKNNFLVVATDSNQYAPGLLHADVNYVVPLCTTVNYVKIIKMICAKEEVDFIIPLIDEELMLLKKLETDKIKVICPSEKFINLATDKFFLMKALSTINVCIPETFLLSENYSSLTFPVVIKPRKGRGSKDVFFVSNNDELNKIIFLKKNCLDDFLVQKKIKGIEYTISVIVNPTNQLIAVVPKKIIEKKGVTRAAITEKNHVIKSLCEKIVKTLNPSGTFNVQLIVSEIDKLPYVLEINPRYSTTTILTIAAGIDEIMIPLNFYINPNLKMADNFSDDLVLLRSIHEEFFSLEEYEDKKSKIINLE